MNRDLDSQPCIKKRFLVTFVIFSNFDQFARLCPLSGSFLKKFIKKKTSLYAKLERQLANNLMHLSDLKL